ncbi:AraC family transcriptional regulator ligand-binding domain-containing protein [Roseateles sp. BYS78W]|uniref:AraC family transcriptional regulator ligand-binding domain-containing protein n=1 Tax=Pelomonas candidula TaxID=3299025 RepID=A0ABW7HLP6_9BURK
MSTSASYTVSAAFVENLVWAAAEEGLDVARWQADLAGRHRDDDRLPLSFFSELWVALLAQTDDPLIGLKLGARFRLGRYGLVEFFLLNARTVQEAMAQAVGYWRLVIDEEKSVRLVARGDALRLLIEPRVRHPVAAYEMDLCYVLRMMSLLLGRPSEGLGLMLGLGHAQPASTSLDDYRTRLGCDVRFDEDCYWLELPAALARQDLPGSHPVLLQALAAQAELQLKLLDRLPAVVAQVSQLIELGANDVDAVAVRIGLSARTLQRRLKEEGASFGALRDDALRRRAEKLLAEPRMALKEVAFFLGYEERGLAQACQRWFGASPGALRARRLAEA